MHSVTITLVYIENKLVKAGQESTSLSKLHEDLKD
jgi:hypothetical protein